VPHGASITVLVIALVITGAVAVGVQIAHRRNEDRLLHQRAREAATVVSASIPNVSTPLITASALAEATDGNAASFSNAVAPLLGQGRPFVSASLWRFGVSPPRPLAVVGTSPVLEQQSPADIEALFRRANSTGQLTIKDLLSAPLPHLGYVYAAPAGHASYVVYAEAALPRGRRAMIDRNSAFSDLGYAIYLGTKPDPARLIASSPGSPQQHRHASVSIPFGDTNLLMLVTARHDLGGGLLASLPWAILVVGALFAIGAAVETERLSRRRETAEHYALENARLFAEQRSVAQVLQQSLLPTTLPEVAGIECAARYLPGVDGVDIGGDWYDITDVDGRVLFVVGDVSGRGVEAASVMASLRYSMHAYAVQGDPPETILEKASRLVSLTRDGHFATVLCGVVDIDGKTLTIANAGHPDPLLIANGTSTYVTTNRGLPVGIDPDVTYEAATVPVPDGATMLAFTDGLVERRGEVLDEGFERLRGVVRGNGSLEHMLDDVVGAMAPDGPNDDIALIGLRWQNKTAAPTPA
jgi:serine phosphatase RsbU (regulator of sigma subunit)